MQHGTGEGDVVGAMEPMLVDLEPQDLGRLDRF
jgi:hypothetical protein